MTKQQQILLGQGEAERKKLVMVADGALTQKLDAYVSTQKVWAEAFAKRAVPSMIMGGGAQQDTQAQEFMSLMTAKAAKDLALDLAPKATDTK